MPKNLIQRRAFLRGHVALVVALVLSGVIATTAGALSDRLKIFKTGGDIDVDLVPDGGTLHTMGGHIYVGKAHNDIDLTTMGGNIKLESADASVKATTMAGDIDVNLAKNQSPRAHDISLSSNTGAVILTVPKGYPMIVEVTLAYTDNSNGSFKISDNLDLEQTSSNAWDRLHGTPRKYLYARGRTGNGQNHVIIKTVNGNVTIKEDATAPLN